MPVCQYCGKELNEGMMCDCSQAQAASSVQEAIENDDIKIENFASGSVQPDGQSSLNRSFSVNNPFKGRISKNQIIAAAAGIVLLIAAGGAGSAVSSSIVEKPVKTYFSALNKEDGELLGKYIYDDCMMDAEKWDSIDTKYQSIGKMISEYKSALEDEYGKNVKIKYKIELKNKIKRSDLKYAENIYKDAYDYDVKIKKGYDMLVSVKIKGKKKADDKTKNISVYKIKGCGWKLFPDNGTSIGIY